MLMLTQALCSLRKGRSMGRMDRSGGVAGDIRPERQRTVSSVM